MPEKIEPIREIVDGGAIATTPALDVSTSFNVQTSLLTDSPEDRSKVLELVEGPAATADEVMGTAFLLSDYILHPVTLEDPNTGEVTNAIRTVLIRPDGLPIACVSLGVLKSLKRLGWVKGSMPPWEPPLRVKLTQVSTRLGRRTYKLVTVK